MKKKESKEKKELRLLKRAFYDKGYWGYCNYCHLPILRLKVLPSPFSIRLRSFIRPIQSAFFETTAVMTFEAHHLASEGSVACKCPGIRYQVKERREGEGLGSASLPLFVGTTLKSKLSCLSEI